MSQETQAANRASALPGRGRGLLLALHRRLLPADSEIGWTPYLWLFYLSMPIGSFLIHPPATLTMVLGVLSLGIFLGLYFKGYWRCGLGLLWNIAGIVALGVAWTPLTTSAMMFFIYGAGFAGAVGPPKIGRRVLLGIMAVVVGVAFLFSQHPLWAVLTACLCGMVGATNIYFAELGKKNRDLRRSREEVERLATVAERERISRDLHDLLGHTLSLITLKAELARKLSERGDPRAGTEIADVERISRETLRQVRAAVEGYREAGLTAELARARLICEARGITVEASLAAVELDPRQEVALALVLREAVTNVARHAQASRCHITLVEDAGAVVLRVHDNGQVGTDASLDAQGPSRAGHGLVGMRERLAELGGELHIDSADGWLLEARILITGRASSEQGAVASNPLQLVIDKAEA